jgi:hypothetical protein
MLMGTKYVTINVKEKLTLKFYVQYIFSKVLPRFEIVKTELIQRLRTVIPSERCPNFEILGSPNGSCEDFFLLG